MPREKPILTDECGDRATAIDQRARVAVVDETACRRAPSVRRLARYHDDLDAALRQAVFLTTISCSPAAAAAFLSSASASDSSHEAWLIKKMRSACTGSVLAIWRIVAAAVRLLSAKEAYSGAVSIIGVLCCAVDATSKTQSIS